AYFWMHAATESPPGPELEQVLVAAPVAEPIPSEPDPAPEADPATEADPEAGAADEEPVPEAAEPTAEAEPAAPGRADAPSEPPPARDAPPDPRPAAAPAVSVRSLVERGWSAIDRGDLAGAISTFRQAYSREPNDPQVNYGYGYAMLERGDTEAASDHLCRAAARSGGDVTLDREVAGVIKRAGISCR